jgi:hypothetical protein
MIDQMEQLEEWLHSLTEPQLRAFACQRGVKVWRTASIVKLRKELCSQLLAEVMEVV